MIPDPMSIQLVIVLKCLVARWALNYLRILQHTLLIMADNVLDQDGVPATGAMDIRLLVVINILSVLMILHMCYNILGAIV